MSKFKVGDEALLDGKKVIITGVSTVVGKKGYVYEIDDSVVCYADYLFKEYISPHDDLLKIGWRYHGKTKDYFLYKKGVEVLYIYKNKKFSHIDDLYISVNTDLELAKILVRYMEEL